MRALRRIFPEAPRVAGNASYRVAGRAIEALRSVVAMPVIARILGPEGFGEWAICVAPMAILSPLVYTALEETLLLECPRSPQHEASLLRSARRIGWIACFAAVLGLGAFGYARGGVEAAGLAAVAGLLLVPEVAGLRRTLLTIRLREKAFFAATLVASAVFLAGLAVVATAWPTTWGVGALYLLAAAARNLVLTWSAARLGHPGDGATCSTVALVRRTVPRAVSGLAVELQFGLDIVLVGGLIGADAAGLLSASWRVPYLALLIPFSLTPSLVASFAGTDDGESAVATARLTRLLSVCGAIVAIGLAAGAPIVAGLFGDGFEPVTGLMPILALRVALVYGVTVPTVYLMCSGREGAVLLSRVAAAAFLAIGVCLAAPFGIAAVCVVLVGSESVKGAVVWAAWRRARRPARVSRPALV